MISALQNVNYGHMFYQVPIPLTIGNLPVGDFLSHQYEYDYLRIYKVPSQNKCIYWSKFHNNYIMRSLDNINNMFPQLRVSNNDSWKYALNPFMNDLNRNLQLDSN